MDSPNVEHLLQNYKISDVVQIQRRLMSDVDKKKNDLKTLIGERYNELLDATDSIEHMEKSVNHLIVSLKGLNVVLEKIQIEANNEQNATTDSSDYSKAILSKILLDLPLQIWNSLAGGNTILATYNYFYGIYLYKMLENENLNFLRSRLHYYNKLTIEDLNCCIVEYCWKYIAEESIKDEVDHSNFADVFSCILLLKHYGINNLVEDFYAKEALNISTCLQTDSSLSSLLEVLLNIIVNTIKCSRVFYQDSNYEALIVQRYSKIINFTSNSNMHKYEHTIHQRYNQYKIAFDLSGDSSQLGSNLTFDKIEEWVQVMQNKIAPILESRMKRITSIKEIFREISFLENKLNQNYRFSEWQDYIHIIDLNACIWQGCVKSAFQRRVFEIVQTKIDSIINQVETLLLSNEKDLSQCDTTLVEFVWKELTAANKNNDFMNLISKSCEIVNAGFEVLFDDISELKEYYQNYLSTICDKMFDFLLALEKRISSLKATKQFVLFGAVFFDKMLTSSPNIRNIFDLLQSSSNQTSWTKMENQIQIICDSYFCNWFEFVVKENFANLNSLLFTDLSQFLQQLTIWEKVSIVDGNLPEKPSNSAIEVPMQISLSILEAIQNICFDINKHCAYALSRTVLIYILRLISENIASIYEDAISNIKSSHYPKTAKQVVAIQLYFDLLFVKNLLTIAKDDSLRLNQLAKMNELMTQLEDLIDPFDLHIMFPSLKTNTDKLFKSSSIAFGFLYAEKSITNSLKTDSTKSTSEPTKEVKHNIMLVHTCDSLFATL